MRVAMLGRFGVLLAAGACAPITDPVPSRPSQGPEPVVSLEAPAFRYSPEAANAVDALAKYLADVLADPAERRRLHTMLRGSPRTEHKLVWSDFQASDGGRHLLERARAQSGGSAAAFSALVRALPPVDIYVPAAAHRQRWSFNSPIGVVPLTDVTSGLYAYLPGGERQLLDRRSMEPTPMAMLVLGPPEFAPSRPDVGSAGTVSGGVITMTASGIEDVRDCE